MLLASIFRVSASRFPLRIASAPRPVTSPALVASVSTGTMAFSSTSNKGDAGNHPQGAQPVVQDATQAQEQSPKSDEVRIPTSPNHALPGPTESGAATVLDVSGGGSTVKLDGLGPLVVNQDGTMSRIGNWKQMTEIERQNTLRILGKRNKLRLATLRGEGQGTQHGGEEKA